MTNYQRTANWLKACGKEVGNSQHISTQIGAHIEELCELLACLRVSKAGWSKVLERATTDLHDLAVEIKKGDMVAHIPQHLRVDALDALCDCEVTGNGVAYLSGFDKDAADQEVLRSNESKLVDGKPVILPGGKIGKGPGYSEPNLKGFV